MSALVLRAVGKIYGGPARAARRERRASRPGRVAAVLGPNGAGKTTLLGILSTLVSPSSGDGALGRRARSIAARRCARASATSATSRASTAISPPRENLRFFCALHGRDATPPASIALLARVGPRRRAAPTRAARTFSRGMLQRLALARALAHDPALLLFDEPSAALDPAGAAWLQTELAAERAAGRTVVLVTHDLEAAAADRRSGGHPAPRARRVGRDARRRLRRRRAARHRTEEATGG